MRRKDINSNSHSQNLISWFLYSAIVAIALIYSWYFFVHVNSNEDILTAKSFRVLAQTGRNIIQKESGLKKIVRNVEDKLTDMHDSLKNEEPLIYFTEKLNKKENKYASLSLFRSELEKGNDLLRIIEGKEFPDNEKKLVEYFDKDSAKYYAVIKKEDFYSPLVRADAFDGFMVLVGDSLNYKVTYHTLTGEVFFNKIDSLINTHTGLVSGSYRQIEVGAKTYHLFLQPLKGTLNKGIIIGGFIGDENYSNAVRQIDSTAVILILLGFLIFVLSIPFIKLAVMSKYEKLDISDVTLILGSLLIGTMVMTLLVFYLHHAASGRENINSKLRTINIEIKESFEDELNAAYKSLSIFDDLRKDSIPRNSYESVLSKKYSDNILLDSINIESVRDIYPYFKTIFWMDSTGQQLFQFARRNFTGNLTKLKSRYYFKHAGDWLLHVGDRELNKPDTNFMLESIISVTSGEKLAALSKESNITVNRFIKPKSDNDESNDVNKYTVKVAAISSNMYSVINTIVEPGYGFCIIGEEGDVLFHSNTDKNLQENFTNESTNNSELFAAISGRTFAHFTTSYQSRNHSCYVSPIGNIPLYLITFHDDEYVSSIEVSSLLITISFCFMVLIFCVFLFVLMSLLLYRPSTLHKKYNPFFWLARSNKLENDGQYRKLFFYNSLGAVLFILFSTFANDSAASLFYMASFCCASFYYVSYVLLKNGSFPAPISINYSHLMIAGILLVALINFYSFLTLESGGYYVLAFQVVMLTASLLSEKQNGYTNKILPGKLDYKMFLFSWVAIVSYLPAVVFFIHAYNYESLLDTKLKLLESAKLIEARDYSIETLYRQKIDRLADIKENQKNLGIYGDISFWSDTSRGKILPDDTCSVWSGTNKLKKLPEDSCMVWSNTNKLEILPNYKYGEIIFKMKSQGERLSYKKAGLVRGKSVNDNIIWKKGVEDNHLYLRYSKSKKHTNDTGRDIILNADISTFGFNSLNLAILLIVGHLITLYLLFVLIRYSCSKIYGDGFLPSQIKYIDESINNTLGQNKNLSIIFGHSTLLLNWIERLNNPELYKKELGVKEIVVYAYSENCTYDIKPIVIEGVMKISIKNLQYDPDNPENSIVELKMLIEQLKHSKEQIIIATTVPLPVVFKIADNGKKAGAKKDEEKKDKNIDQEIIKGLVNKITNQENFTINFYYPIKPFEEDKNSEEYGSENEILGIIKEELSDLVFMGDLPADILEYYYKDLINEGNLKDYTIKERLIQEIESLVENDYYQILNSCTAKEKFVLFDYAQDQLVNYNNKFVIEALYYKGIIKYDGAFKIFNESFRDYILTVIDPEKLKLQFGTKIPRGNWAKFKIPLFIVAFGLFILLGVQTNILSNLSSVLTSVAAGLALLTKFSGVFSGIPGAGKK